MAEENIEDLALQNVYTTDTVKKKSLATNPQRKPLYICDLLEPNTAIFDEEEDYLKQIAFERVECPCELHQELLTSYDLCDNLFSLMLYQQILHHETRVRLKPGKDIFNIKSEIERVPLSLTMKQFLFTVSELAYKLLKMEKLLGDFIELDSESEGIVDFKGQERSLMFHSDVLSLVNKSQILQNSDEKAKQNANKDEAKVSNRTKKYRFPRKGQRSNINAKTYGVTKLETEYEITESEDSDQSEAEGSVNVTLTFVLTVRNSLPAVQVLEQCIGNILNDKTKKYIIASHIGPMVEEQQIALYKHRCSRQYKGVFETKDMDKIMQIWENTKAKTTFVMADPKESMKYSIFNSPSYKDSDDEDDDDNDGCFSGEDKDDIDKDYDEKNFEWLPDNDDEPSLNEQTQTFNTKSLCFSSKIIE